MAFCGFGHEKSGVWIAVKDGVYIYRRTEISDRYRVQRRRGHSIYLQLVKNKNKLNHLRRSV